MIIIGIDESGRGALAGSLIVCAAAFRHTDQPFTMPFGSKQLTIRDSKKISNPQHREALASEIRKKALAIAVVERTAAQIDARLLYSVFPAALRDAVVGVIGMVQRSGGPMDPESYMIQFDGDVPMPRDLGYTMHAIPDGDNLVWQISAASIVAKVECDAIMQKLHTQYPVYGFDFHKGYGTKTHLERLRSHGTCPAHRKTFRPIAELDGPKVGFEI